VCDTKTLRVMEGRKGGKRKERILGELLVRSWGLVVLRRNGEESQRPERKEEGENRKRELEKSTHSSPSTRSQEQIHIPNNLQIECSIESDEDSADGRRPVSELIGVDG